MMIEYETIMELKKYDFLNWDSITYRQFYYLYNECHLTDGLLAEIFDIPKKLVTKKRKDLNISMYSYAIDKTFEELEKNGTLTEFLSKIKNNPNLLTKL